MTSLGPNAADDQILVQYLLGALPDPTAEQLDELSVADDEFALRLSAVENDLTDAYARGELSGEILEKFQKFYLSSARRHEKVKFAESLLSLTRQTAPVSVPGEPASSQSIAVKSSWWSFLTVPRLQFAVVAMLVVAGLVVVDNLRLHNQVRQAQSDRTALEQREQELRTKLEQQSAADAETVKELGRVRQSLAEMGKLPAARSGGSLPASIAFLALSPQMRGQAEMPTLVLERGIIRCRFRLELEGADFSQYRAELKDPSNGQILWRSGPLHAAIIAQNQTVAVELPASVFRPRIYALELSGNPSRGGADVLLSSYVFRVATN